MVVTANQAFQLHLSIFTPSKTPNGIKLNRAKLELMATPTSVRNVAKEFLKKKESKRKKTACTILATGPDRDIFP